MELQVLTEKIAKYHPADRVELVEKAYAYAKNAHEGQKRASGEPYFVHPYNVALILADLMLDAATIAGGLLHDVVEDCGVTISEISAEFGQEVALLVDGVTKLTRLDFSTNEERQIESIRKMILAMAKDMRVVLIKLADRLHNIRTLEYRSPEKQKKVAKETLEIYAPLAHRLGIYTIKGELEDLCLKYIDPESYRKIAQRLGAQQVEREETIQTVIEVLRKRLDEQNIKADISGRPKHIYSIYKKMVLQNKPFEEIYDLLAIRVIVDTIADCYTALGNVHTYWKTIPGRYKDYISLPKANNYQSLHTTVVGDEGMPFEVQIRTWDMHSTAEFGIAAHWRYKEGRQSASDLDEKLRWIRQLVDWQSDVKDSEDFIELLKVDLFSDTVLVFTPKGEVIDMPRGATPIDFAYRIHSAVGNKCVGAKVNGRMVPLGTSLNTGDIVEILTTPSARGPSMDWLKIAKTSQAKNKIRAWFKRELKEENIERGRDMIEREARRQGIDINRLLKSEYIETINKRYGFSATDDMYAAVGYGALTTAQIIGRLQEEARKHEEPPAPKVEDLSQREKSHVPHIHQQENGKKGVYVVGEQGMLVRFARCCNPVPGDDIVGYITRGRGVSVHRRDCVNMNAPDVEPDRLIDVSWDDSAGSGYIAEVQIIAYDHNGLIAELASLLGNMNISYRSFFARTNKNKTSTVHIELEIKDTKQLQDIIKQLKKRQDIIDVYRVGA